MGIDHRLTDRSHHLHASTARRSSRRSHHRCNQRPKRIDWHHNRLHSRHDYGNHGNMTVIWAVIAAALPGLLAAIVGFINRSKIAEVHVLVNSKMSEALATIANLRLDAAAIALSRAADARDVVTTAAASDKAIAVAAATEPPHVTPNEGLLK